MFTSEEVFEPSGPVAVDRALEATGWSDVIELELGGVVVYRDRLGNAADRRPTLEVVRERVHVHPDPWTLVLGRERDVWHELLVVTSGRLFVRWQVVSRDRSLDPGPDESPEAHRERVSALVRAGGLQQRIEALEAQRERRRGRTCAAGLVLRQATVPTTFEAGLDRVGPYERWFADYAGSTPPAATERALLAGLAVGQR